MGVTVQISDVIAECKKIRDIASQMYTQARMAQNQMNVIRKSYDNYAGYLSRNTVQEILLGISGSGSDVLDLWEYMTNRTINTRIGIEVSPQWRDLIASISIDGQDTSSPVKTVITANSAVGGVFANAFYGFAAGDKVVLSGCSHSAYNNVEVTIDALLDSNGSIRLTTSLGSTDVSGDTSIVVRQTYEAI